MAEELFHLFHENCVVKFHHTFVSCIPQGFTLVINPSLKYLVSKNASNYVFIILDCFISMVGGKVFSYPENFRALKVLISSKYGGHEVSQDSSFEFGSTNFTSEFLSKFPYYRMSV